MKLTSGLVLTVAMISGCATNSGVMSLGPDTYTITTGADMFRGGGTGAKQAALSESQQYCTKLSKEILVTNMRESRIAGGKSMEVIFRCLPKGDSGLIRPTYEKSPDTVIEDRRK